MIRLILSKNILLPALRGYALHLTLYSRLSQRLRPTLYQFSPRLNLQNLCKSVDTFSPCLAGLRRDTSAYDLTETSARHVCGMDTYSSVFSRFWGVLACFFSVFGGFLSILGHFSIFGPIFRCLEDFFAFLCVLCGEFYPQNPVDPVKIIPFSAFRPDKPPFSPAHGTRSAFFCFLAVPSVH